MVHLVSLWGKLQLWSFPLWLPYAERLLGYIRDDSPYIQGLDSFVGLLEQSSRLLAILITVCAGLCGFGGLRGKKAAEAAIQQTFNVEGDLVQGPQTVNVTNTTTNIHQAPEVGVQALHGVEPQRGFYGRERELGDLVKLVEGGANIIGITGMGGIGKTSLALKLAERIESHFPDAQIRVEMLGTSQRPLSPAAALERVLRAFHPTEKLPEDEDALRAAYLSVLHNERALIFLDNARDAEQVKPLEPPATCALIFSSRQRISWGDVHSFPLDEMQPDDAQRLLRGLAPHLSVEEAAELATLCRKVPIALTNAGSALAKRRTLKPAAYLERLKNERERLRLVDATFAISYDLLDEAQRQRWRQLAVFPSTFDGRAAAAVWGTDPNDGGMLEEATNDLDELWDFNLVEWNESTKRFRLHDLARLFADARLTDVERDAAQQSHAVHYLMVLAAADQLYQQGNEGILLGLVLFDVERANIETGQRWAATHAAQDATATRLCIAYPNVGIYILALRLHLRDQIQWLELAIRAAREIGDRRGEEAALNNLGPSYTALGQVQKAIDHYQQALVISREIGDRRGEGATLGNLGLAYANLGEVQTAIDHYQQRLVIAREIQDRRGEAYALFNMSLAQHSLGARDNAITNAEASLTILEQIEAPNAAPARRQLAAWRGEAPPPDGPSPA